MRTYRAAFLITLAVSITLAAAVILFGLFWWRSHSAARMPSSGAAMASMNGPAAATESSPSALAPIQLSPQRLESIGVKTGVVGYQTLDRPIRVPANVELDETRLSYVQVRFAGWIQKVFADATYQYVRRGQPLFTIYSPELVTTEQEYLLARQDANILLGSTVAGVAQGANQLLVAAAERLKQWQIPERQIRDLETSGKVQQELEVDSPVSGTITERNALPNLYAQPETRLYTLADLSTVWVYAEVPQNDAGLVKLGDRATVTVDAYPGRVFQGRVTFIVPQVDMATRSVRFRLVFPNPRLVLKPGMYVNAQIEAPLGRQLAIPASAVFQSGTRQIVFVDHGRGRLEPRQIEVGPQAGDSVAVLEGLQAGECVVTSANFLIDSESELQAALGAFASPAAAAPAGAAGTEANAAEIELSTDPSPPHKGSNVLRVKLTDSHGAAITGAQVSVTLFMSAMPAMGMPAMRVAAKLKERGDGMYEGAAELGSGGSWQITIVAEKNGQTLATEQRSLMAEGGM